MDRLFQLDVELGWNQFSNAIHVREADIQYAAHVLDRGASAHRSEGDDLRYLFPAIFFGDVLNYFSAPARMEIDIDIRHTDAFRVQEPLEQQAVFQWIDV